MSARTTRSPGSRRRLRAPLRPPWAVPPAPRAPVGFSKVAARESRLVSTTSGFHTRSIMRGRASSHPTPRCPAKGYLGRLGVRLRRRAVELEGGEGLVAHHPGVVARLDHVRVPR